MRYKKTLFFILLCLLLFPLVQQLFEPLDDVKLHGDVKQVELHELTWKHWLKGDYQKQAETYYNASFGLRNYAVRFYQQWQYDFYKKARAKQVVIGKEEVLFEQPYIEAYLGHDFVGDSVIEENCRKLKLISDSLKANGTELVLVLAAGKGSYYPEYFPEEWSHLHQGERNINVYKEQFNRYALNTIDFNQWFVQEKSEWGALLYPKRGIHWSTFGMYRVVDSLTRNLEELLQQDLPDIIWEDTVVTSTPRLPDNDIELGMNLMRPISNQDTFLYPQVRIQEKGKYKPKTVVIGDSFFWSMYAEGIAQGVLQGQFWYYHTQLYKPGQAQGYVGQLEDYLGELKKQDVVILLSTEANLFKLGWGFIDRAYAAFTREDQTFIREREVLRLIDEIKRTPEWFASIQKKAQESGLALDSVLRKDAEYVYDTH